MSIRLQIIVAGLVLVMGCASEGDRSSVPAAGADMDAIAESYVKLVLALGEHDGDYVDAYHGPPEWRQEPSGLELASIESRAVELGESLEAFADGGLRRDYLTGQLRALAAHAARLAGAVTTFDEESRDLYDAVAPQRDAAYYQTILDRLEPLLPGAGPLIDRYEAFKSDFVIEPDRLDEVFRTSSGLCRSSC